MKQMWDKKEIETLIDEHGGGGSGAKWGQITGTLSNQTDLKNALDAKQDTIDSSHKLSVSLVDGLAAVATSGDYDDLLNKPAQLTIDEKTIIADAETGDIKTAIGGYVIDNSIEHTTVLPFDEGYYALYNTPENTTLYNLFNSLEVNQHFDIYFEKSSDGETWEADSHNPVDCYIVSKDPENSEVEVYNDDVYDNGFTCTDTMIEVGWFGDFEDDTYIRMRIVIGDLEIEEIDGRVIPVDGTTITLNSSNELQGFSGDYNDLTNKPVIPTNADYVDKTTNQTVGGYKTFEDGIIIGDVHDDNVRVEPNKVVIHEDRASDSQSHTLEIDSNRIIREPLTSGIVLNLPTVSGTLALTSDIPSTSNFVSVDTDQVIYSNKTFINGNTVIFANPAQSITLARNGSASTVVLTAVAPSDSSLANNALTLNMGGFNLLEARYADLRPYNNNAYSLGTSSRKFVNLYLSGNLSDGTNSISIANIASKSEIPDIYYKNGDKFKNLNYLQLYGYITNGGKDIQLTVILPKLLTNIASITVNKISMITRGVSGYVGSNSYTDYAADTTNYTISSAISAENAICITIRANTAWSGGQNNTPVCAVINSALGSLELTFNEA